MHPVGADAAHPALLDRDRFGVQALRDAEPLRVDAAGHHAVGRGLRQVLTMMLACSGGSPPVPSSSMS